MTAAKTTAAETIATPVTISRDHRTLLLFYRGTAAWVLMGVGTIAACLAMSGRDRSQRPPADWTSRNAPETVRAARRQPSSAGVSGPALG